LLCVLFVGEEPSNTGENMAEPNTCTNMYTNFSSTVPIFLRGGYTLSLLLGIDQEALAARKLNFDEPVHDSTFEQ
jgi:hypothetical protein